MYFELTNFKNFKDTMISAEQILDEIKLEADSDGLRFRGLDRSHVCFMSMNIERSYFDTYTIEEPDNCIVDTSELVKVLKRIKSDDTLCFSFNEENVTIKFEGESTRTFNIRNIDMEYESPTMPNIHYNISTDIDLKQFENSVKDCELYDDKLKISTEEEYIILSAKGDRGEYIANIDTLETLTGNYSSIFNIDWMKKFFKFKFSETFKLNMGDDMPLLLQFEDINGLNVEFLIAPRIETEE